MHGNLLPSIAAFERFVDEKLQAFKQATVAEYATGLRRATQRTRGDPLDPRKKFIAEIIKSHEPYPKISVSEIFREADSLQDKFPKKACYRPPPAWGVRFWSDMKGDN